MTGFDHAWSSVQVTGHDPCAMNSHGKVMTMFIMTSHKEKQSPKEIASLIFLSKRLDGHD